MAERRSVSVKLDVQGLEARVLRGGPRTLARTAAVVCEIMVQNFHAINAQPEGAGFALHDLSDLYRTPEQALGWFYATYLHRDYAAFRTAQYWQEAENETIIAQQQQRREDVLARIEALLSRIKVDGKP